MMASGMLANDADEWRVECWRMLAKLLECWRVECWRMMASGMLANDDEWNVANDGERMMASGMLANDGEWNVGE